jgi:RNA-directed DNA polymerase
MLEKAIVTTRDGKYTYIQYARFADDLVILIDSWPRHDWLVKAVEKRIREEMAKLRVEINEEKSRIADLAKGGSFSFLGFEYRRILGRNKKWRPYYAPKLKKRTALLAKLRKVFRQHVTQPVARALAQRLQPTGVLTRLVRLPPGQDPNRWFVAGATAGDFARYLQPAPSA